MCNCGRVRPVVTSAQLEHEASERQRMDAEANQVVLTASVNNAIANTGADTGWYLASNE